MQHSFIRRSYTDQIFTIHYQTMYHVAEITLHFLNFKNAFDYILGNCSQCIFMMYNKLQHMVEILKSFLCQIYL